MRSEGGGTRDREHGYSKVANGAKQQRNPFGLINSHYVHTICIFISDGEIPPQTTNYVFANKQSIATICRRRN